MLPVLPFTVAMARPSVLPGFFTTVMLRITGGANGTAASTRGE